MREACGVPDARLNHGVPAELMGRARAVDRVLPTGYGHLTIFDPKLGFNTYPAQPAGFRSVGMGAKSLAVKFLSYSWETLDLKRSASFIQHCWRDRLESSLTRTDPEERNRPEGGRSAWWLQEERQGV
ncbi:hypothetical protein U9M48_030459 [Paspalum notatum var. saurae]|uniref:Uncharacterized protein n=1 Tax=Paspalum notatum var. saurae TaxID=547442 RepID=A0AAQ3U5B8_PASNO